MSLAVGLPYAICLFATKIAREHDQNDSPASPFAPQTYFEDSSVLRKL
jgi:hypothetical protein